MKCVNINTKEEFITRVINITKYFIDMRFDRPQEFEELERRVTLKLS